MTHVLFLAKGGVCRFSVSLQPALVHQKGRTVPKSSGLLLKYHHFQWGSVYAGINVPSAGLVFSCPE